MSACNTNSYSISSDIQQLCILLHLQIIFLFIFTHLLSYSFNLQLRKEKFEDSDQSCKLSDKIVVNRILNTPEHSTLQCFHFAVGFGLYKLRCLNKVIFALFPSSI